MAVDLGPYAAGLAATWRERFGDSRHAELTGTLMAMDLSGFTRLSERLARRSRGGAEELNRAINTLWDGLVPLALDEGGDLLQFGGDALLVLFAGTGSEPAACRAALGMQLHLRRHGRLDTPAGPVRLRMTVGVHAGVHHLYLIGGTHRELVLAGPSATATVELEGRAASGQVLVSDTVAASLPAGCTSPVGDGAHRLRRMPASTGGTALAVPSAGDEAAAFVPPEVLEVVSAPGQWGEHRQVTVAFVKPAGLDRALAEGGPDAVLARLDRVAAAVDDAAARYGICWLATDIAPDSVTFLLTAGAPVAREDDEERMLRALRHVTDSLAADGNDEGGVGGPPDPGVRIGVHRGRAFAADVGHARRRTYAVIGDTTNLAARLAARATPGTVLASQAVIDRCRARFQLRPLDPFPVKGKRGLIDAAEVGPLEQAGEATDGRVLVGRQPELEQLNDAWRRVRAGAGAVVEIVGEGGVGKSALVATMAGAVAAADPSARVLWLRGHPYEGFNSYAPLGPGLRDLLGIDPGADGPEAGRALLRFVRRRRPDLGPWTPLVAGVLRATVPSTRAVDRLDPAQVQRQRHELLVALVAAAVPDGPLAVVAEDLHWFDDASLEVVGRLRAAAVGRPWLVLTTSRPGAGPAGTGPSVGDPNAPGAPSGSGVRRIELGPLPDDDAARLALLAAGDLALRDDVLERFVARAGGNPLFLRELVEAERTGAADGELPESIERVVAARIDRLRPADRTLLRQASVLGTEVDLAVMAGLLDDPDLADPRQWAALSGFLALPRASGRSGRGHRRVARFRHELVRAAAYEGLAERRRRQIHGQLVDVLGHAAEPPVERLAYHAGAARLADPAWRWSLAAAGQAEAAANFGEAALHLAQALAAASNVADLGDDEVAAVTERLGDVQERLGRYEPAMAAYRLAQQRRGAQAPVATARLLRKRGRVAEKTGHYGRSLSFVTRGLRLLDGAPSGPEATVERCHLALTRALTRTWQGRPAEAERWARRALADAEAVGAVNLRAQAHLQLEMILLDLGSPERELHGERAIALFTDLGDDRGLGNALLNVGVSEYNEAAWDSSLGRYERAAAVFARAGFVTESAHPVNNQAEILTDQGRLDEAEERLHVARRRYRATGYALGVAATTSAFARLALRRGEVAEAHRLLDEAQAAFGALGAEPWVVDTRVRRVETLAYGGEPGRALAEAEAVAGALAEAGMPLLPITLDRLRALALWGQSDAAEASARLEAALDAARAANARFEVLLALTARGELDTATGRTEEPARRAERDALRAALGVVWLPALPVLAALSGPSAP